VANQVLYSSNQLGGQVGCNFSLDEPIGGGEDHCKQTYLKVKERQGIKELGDSAKAQVEEETVEKLEEKGVAREVVTRGAGYNKQWAYIMNECL